jgi:hypothetical protein
MQSDPSCHKAWPINPPRTRCFESGARFFDSTQKGANDDQSSNPYSMQALQR